MSSISPIGKASSAPYWRTAPSWPARRPSHSSRSGLRSRQNSTYSPCSRPGISASTASGSGKPVRYWKSLSWRYTCSTSRLRIYTGAAGRMAMLLGSICAISALRRRAYSARGMLAMSATLMQGRLGNGRVRLAALGKQQQRRHTQIFHHFHVIVLAILGLFQATLYLGNRGQVLQHLHGFGTQRRVAEDHAEAVEEALAPLAKRPGPLTQHYVVARQQQNQGDVMAREFALDHLLQTNHCLAHVVCRLGAKQLAGILQPGVGLEAGAGAAASQQQAVQRGGRNGSAAARQQGGESGIGRVRNGHGV